MLCPSADERMEKPVVFGVVHDAGGVARVGYLKRSVDASRQLLAVADPRPTEVFRVAAVCMGARCVHQAEGHCTLIKRIIDVLAPVTEKVPPCAIRPNCVWWNERGADACFRCPRIVTTNLEPSDQERVAAGPKAAISTTLITDN